MDLEGFLLTYLILIIRIVFIQTVGCTDDEMEAANTWSTIGMLKVLEQAYPLGIVDLNRDSVLNNPQMKALIEEGIQKEGSDCDGLYVKELKWVVKGKTSVKVLYDVQTHKRIIRILKGRIHFNNDLILRGQGGYKLSFVPTRKPCVSIYRNTLMIEINNAMATEYCNIPAKPGKYYLKGFGENLTIIIK